MIKSLIQDVCIMDGLPLKESPIYQFYLWLWGEERCRCLVGEDRYDLVHPPPEVSSNELSPLVG